jgi:hypothetical protein
VISLNVTAVRFQDNPILTPHSSPSLGMNLNGPSLIRVPAWLERPLGRYYLYFAHHRGTFIRLAYADRLSGPWHVYEPGTLQLSEAPSCHDHIASPDVHVDEVRREIRMYFHCPTSSPGSGPQRTFLAVSHDGLHFSAAAKSLGPRSSEYSNGEGTTTLSPGQAYSSDPAKAQNGSSPVRHCCLAVTAAMYCDMRRSTCVGRRSGSTTRALGTVRNTFWSRAST